jgi:hypothetical protein
MGRAVISPAERHGSANSFDAGDSSRGEVIATTWRGLPRHRYGVEPIKTPGPAVNACGIPDAAVAGQTVRGQSARLLECSRV